MFDILKQTELQRELDAERVSCRQLRELLTLYNLGGWTDSERLIKERDFERGRAKAMLEGMVEMREEHANLQSVLATAREEITALTKSRDDVIETGRKMSDEVWRLRGEIGRLRDELSTAQKDADAFCDSRVDLMKQCDALDVGRKAAVWECNQLRDRIAVLEARAKRKEPPVAVKLAVGEPGWSTASLEDLLRPTEPGPDLKQKSRLTQYRQSLMDALSDFRERAPGGSSSRVVSWISHVVREQIRVNEKDRS